MTRAYTALVALGIIWGSNFIYMKWAAELVSPGQVVLLRVLFGFLPLAVAAWRARVITRAQLHHLPHFAVMSVLATSFYYYGFVKGTAALSSSVAGLLSGAVPIFAFLCTFIILRDERPTKLVFAGVAIGFLGIILSAQPWHGTQKATLPGILWMMAGSLSLGISYVYARRFLSPLQLPPLALATWQIGLGLLTLLIISDYHGIMAFTANLHTAIGLVLGLGVLGTGIAYLIYYFIIQKLGAVGASGVNYIPPVVAVIIGMIAGEPVSLTDVLAMLLILGGVALIQVGRQETV